MSRGLKDDLLASLCPEVNWLYVMRRQHGVCQKSSRMEGLSPLSSCPQPPQAGLEPFLSAPQVPSAFIHQCTSHAICVLKNLTLYHEKFQTYIRVERSVTTIPPCFSSYQQFPFWFHLSPQLFFLAEKFKAILDFVSFHSLILQDLSLKDKDFGKKVTAKLLSYLTKLTITL